MFAESLKESFLMSLSSLWEKTLSFVPELIGAIIVLILGLIIASGLGKLSRKLVSMAKVDNLLEKTGLTKELGGLGINLVFSGLIGFMVKWFFIIATIIAVVDILNISELSSFLRSLILYIPNVIVATIILIIGLALGKLAKNAVLGAMQKAKMTETVAFKVAMVAKMAIVIFSLMAALVQLGIAADLIRVLFSGLVFMLALAGGLAFGLGGKEHAAKFLSSIKKKD